MAKKTAIKKVAAAPKKVAAPILMKKSRKATTPKNKNSLSYTQSEFLENLMGFCGLPKRASARELAGDLSALIMECLKRGYKIPLVGLGKLYVRKTKARMGRNPATGEPIHIPSKKRIRFSASKALKQAVLFG
ncbi:MAG: HU family DNA-binding protein [bacterium]|nr:HU family DNA-binding protein [bacterium]